MSKQPVPRALDLVGSAERSAEARRTFTTEVIAYDGEFGEAVKIQVMSDAPLDASKKQALLVDAIGMFRRLYDKWPMKNVKKESVLLVRPTTPRPAAQVPSDSSPPSSP